MAKQFMAAIESSEIQPAGNTRTGIPEIGPLFVARCLQRDYNSKPCYLQIRKKIYFTIPVLLRFYKNKKIGNVFNVRCRLPRTLGGTPFPPYTKYLVAIVSATFLSKLNPTNFRLNLVY